MQLTTSGSPPLIRFLTSPAFCRKPHHWAHITWFLTASSFSQEVRRAAAKEWCLWEMGTSKLIPDSAYIDKVNQIATKLLEFAILCENVV